MEWFATSDAGLGSGSGACACEDLVGVSPIRGTAGGQTEQPMVISI